MTVTDILPRTAADIIARADDLLCSWGSATVDGDDDAPYEAHLAVTAAACMLHDVTVGNDGRVLYIGHRIDVWTRDSPAGAVLHLGAAPADTNVSASFLVSALAPSGVLNVDEFSGSVAYCRATCRRLLGSSPMSSPMPSNSSTAQLHCEATAADTVDELAGHFGSRSARRLGRLDGDRPPVSEPFVTP